MPHFTSVLLWVGSVLVLCTRDLYGSDLNENRSKMDPLPCVRSLSNIILVVCYKSVLVEIYYVPSGTPQDNFWSFLVISSLSKLQVAVDYKPINYGYSGTRNSYFVVFLTLFSIERYSYMEWHFNFSNAELFL